MSNEIRGVYGDLEQVANRFASAQSDVAETFQRVRVRPWIHWKMAVGSDADQMRLCARCAAKVLPAVQRLQQSLGEAARVTAAIVQTLRQADEEASSPFRIT